jgi:hypothetical protein
MSNPKKDFWDKMNDAAELSRSSPDHMQAGINLNPQNFETYLPEKLVVIKIPLPRPMTFEEVFGFNPKDCVINWEGVELNYKSKGKTFAERKAERIARNKKK